MAKNTGRRSGAGWAPFDEQKRLGGRFGAPLGLGLVSGAEVIASIVVRDRKRFPGGAR